MIISTVSRDLSVAKQQLRNIDLHPVHGYIPFNCDQYVPYLKKLGTDEAKASLKRIAALKKEKNRINREVKKAEQALQGKINAIRNELTEPQCEDLVMQLLHDGFVEELNTYLSAEVQKTVRAISKLWEKYHISVTELLDERKKAENRLNGFLQQLGYIPKKETDA